jgi:hypothetical protein
MQFGGWKQVDPAAEWTGEWTGDFVSLCARVDSNHWPHPPEARRPGRPAPIGANLRRGTPGDPGDCRGSPTRLVPGTVPQSRRARRKITGRSKAAKRRAPGANRTFDEDASTR